MSLLMLQLFHEFHGYAQGVWEELQVGIHKEKIVSGTTACVLIAVYIRSAVIPMKVQRRWQTLYAQLINPLILSCVINHHQTIKQQDRGVKLRN